MGTNMNFIFKGLTRYVILSCIQHEEEQEGDTAEGSVVKDTTFNASGGGNRKFTALNFPRQ
jgi:hypothetical protein